MPPPAACDESGNVLRANARIREGRHAVNLGFRDIRVYRDRDYSQSLGRAHPQITHIKPNVAMNSLKSCAGPLRMCREKATAGKESMPWATSEPHTAPSTCTADVYRCFLPSHSAEESVAQRHQRIEMSARDGPERQDRSDQRRPRCNCVGEKRDRNVSST